jgi:hypothetical protein
VVGRLTGKGADVALIDTGACKVTGHLELISPYPTVGPEL